MKIYHLNESISELSNDELVRLLETDFSDAYKLALNGHYIYKGMDEVFDTSAYYYKKIENRSSRNTKNYYTLWINNHPDWKKFPKRNVIASTERSYAAGYGLDLYIILPKNGTRIGVCPSEDIWSSFPISRQDGDSSIDMVMSFFGDIFKKELNRDPSTYNELVDCLKKIDPESIDTLQTDDIFFETYMISLSIRTHIMRHGFYDTFYKLLKPSDFINGDIHSIERFQGDSREIWFDSDFIAINYSDRRWLLDTKSILSEDTKYNNWVYPDTNTMKSDFKEYKVKEEPKWKGRASSNGFVFPIFKDYEDYKSKVQSSPIINVTPEIWGTVGNLSTNTSIEDISDMVSSYVIPRDVNRITKGFSDNMNLPYPVILKGNNGLFIMSGNTRLNVANVMGIMPKAILVDVSD